MKSSFLKTKQGINYEKIREYKILDGFVFANKVKPTDEEIEQITEIVGQPL